MGPKYVKTNLPNHKVYFHLCISLLSPVFIHSGSCWRIKLRWLSDAVCFPLSPSPGDLPDLGIESESLMSPAWADGFFTTSHLESPLSL